MATLTERTWQANQSWNFEHVFDTVDGQVLRTTIRRNAYDFQSYGKVDRWDGERWQSVVTRTLEELGNRVARIRNTLTGVTAEDFISAKERLEFDAIEIVGRPV